MPVVGVEVDAGGLDGGVPENLLKHMQRDTGVCHPGRSGVPESVPGEVGQAEAGHDLIPVRRVAHGRRGEHAAFRPGQQPVLGLLAGGETFQDRAERFEDRHLADTAPLGLLRHKAAGAGEGLPSDVDDVLAPVDVPGLEAGDLGGAGREERGEHHEVRVGLVHGPARLRELGQRGDRLPGHGQGAAPGLSAQLQRHDLSPWPPGPALPSRPPPCSR